MTTVAASCDTVTVQQARFVRKQVGHARAFAVVLDASGSMAGASALLTADGVRDIYAHVMASSDYMALCAFSTTVEVLQTPAPKAEVDIEAVLRRYSPAGRTALWDALQQGVLHLRRACRRGGRHPYMVLLTDGQDNASTACSFEQARALVKRPGVAHFHLVVIAVGDASRGAVGAQLEELCAPRHCMLLPVHDVRQIRRAFGEARRWIEAVEVTQVSVSLRS